MFRKLAALGTGLVMTAALVNTLGPATAHAAAGPSMRNCDWNAESWHVRAQRPEQIPMFCIYYKEDGSLYAHDVIHSISWSSWGRDAAHGRGRMLVEGGRSPRVQIKLYDAHTHASGRRYYRKMRVIFPDPAFTYHHRLYH